MSERVWNFSCVDWEQRIRQGKSLMPDLPLYEEEANDALEIFDNLRLPDVIGQPLLKDAIGDWFREIVAAVLGSRDPETNTRMVPELLLLVGKGNSKTTNSAELMLTALIMNQRPHAKHFLIAPSQSTADVAFDTVKGAIELDPELTTRFWIRNTDQTIVDRLLKSELSIKTFSLEILNGPKPVAVLLDEIHLLAKQPNARKIMRQIRGGLQKNSEGFFIMTTTQSNEEPQGVFKEELETARGIRDGKIASSRLLPILYELPMDIATDEEKWQDPKVWPMVMPNLGRSLRLKPLIDDWMLEKEKGEDARRLWASQHLNIQIGLGMKGDGWPGAAFWEKKRVIDETLYGEEGFEELMRRSEVIVFGIDGGGLDDLLGFSAIGREKLTRRWLLWNKAWCRKRVLTLRKEIGVKLEELEKSGDLRVIDDDSNDDVEETVEYIVRAKEAGLLPNHKAVGCDPVGTADITDELVRCGFTTEDPDAEDGIGEVMGVQQGFRLNSAIDTLGRRVAKAEVIHGGSPLMRWCVANAQVEPKGNAKMVTKGASRSAKIDPLIATFVAAHLMAMNPQVERSVYEDRGILMVG